MSWHPAAAGGLGWALPRLACAAMLLLPACGDGDTGSSATRTSPAVKSTATTVTGTRRLTPTTTTPARSTTTAARGYGAILGRHFDDQPVTGFVATNGCSPTGLHYVCKRAGIELSFDTGRRLVSVILFAAGADGFDEYRGPLPGGLTWVDSRAAVERKLGPPASLQPGAPPVKAFAVYRDPALVITYTNTAGSPAGDTRMHHIEVKA